jgi:proline iminopeptidase
MTRINIILTNLKHWLAVLFALSFGAFVAVVVLLLTVIVTLNRFLALSAALLAFIAVGWTLLQKPVRRISARPRIQRWTPIGVLGVTVAVLALVAYHYLLAPAPPYTPIPPTPAINYWDVPTGSRIAYTHQPAQMEQGYPPVILVHGGPGAPPTRQPMISAALAEAGFAVYAYHQVGAGLSSRLDDVRQYTVARHVEDLEAIRQMIRTEQVILIGGSWGGQFIANYLAAYPEHVHRAVVSSC